MTLDARVARWFAEQRPARASRCWSAETDGADGAARRWWASPATATSATPPHWEGYRFTVELVDPRAGATTTVAAPAVLLMEALRRPGPCAPGCT